MTLLLCVLTTPLDDYVCIETRDFELKLDFSLRIVKGTHL